MVNKEFSHLKVKARNNMLVIGGDFNLPDIDCRDLCISGTQYSNRLNAAYLEIVADNRLEQMVDFPTLKGNILDIILTTHPSFKQRCKAMPSIGNSDHDVVLFDTSVTVQRPKPPRKKDLLVEKG